ncbi:right-handed parallel beta-helix repeat-containing protein [Haloferula sargassicola]|uniref:Right handed beta helix domain-containing protein n=1 Tax=Haloferula sargassicola TaxID=490096 RepID=A0ABP9UKV3_9BACT
MKAILPILASLLLPALPAAALTGGPDASGYTFRDSAETDGPTYQWIEIATSGEKIIGNGLGLPTLVTQLDLAPQHMFHGLAASFLRISRHGYLSNDGTDPGDDFTNDCPIDTPPSSGGGSRMAVFHDRIESGLGTWGVYHQYFPTSPHPHYSGRVHVIQWDNVQLVADTTHTPFSFQVLLFGNGDIVYQYKDTPPAAASATVGTVFSSGPTRDGLGYSCNGGGITAGLAILFEPPTVSLTSGNGLAAAVAAVPNGGKIVVDPAVTSISGSSISGSSISGIAVNKVMAIDGGNGGIVDGSDDLDISGGLVTLHNVRVGDCELSVSANLVMHGAGAARLALPAFTSAYLVDSSAGGGVEVTGDSYFEVREGSLSSVLSGSASTLKLTAGASAVLRDCRVSSFKSPSVTATTPVNGAALHLSDATLTCEDCEFPDNDGTGGAIVTALYLAGETTATFERCWIHEHESSSRSIIFDDLGGHSPVVDFSNCAIFGDGIEFRGDTDASFDFCTFANAGASLVPTENATVRFRACAIQDGAPVGLGTGFTVDSQGYNVVASDPQGHFTESTDVVSSTTFLGPTITQGLNPPIRLPLVNGPAADAVPETEPGVPVLDIRGVARPQDAAGDGSVLNDAGAFELESGIVVDSFGGAGTGTTTLDQALTLTPPGGTIYFDPSVSGATRGLGFGLQISKSVTLDASALDRSPIFTGGTPPAFAFRLDPNVTLTLINFTYSGASSALYLYSGSRLVAVDCHFDDNPQGAIYGFTGAGLDLTRCRFRNNGQIAWDKGAAIRMDFDAEVFLRDCQFIGNQAIEGAAIHSQLYGYFDVTNCLFAGNGTPNAVAATLGGVMSQPAGTYYTRFTNCTFTENFAQQGGVYTGSPGAGPLIFRHCTIARNFTSEGIGAIRVTGDSSQIIQFDHTILARNRNALGRDPGNYEGPPITSLGHNLEDGTAVGFTQPTDLTHADPLLGPLSNYGGSGRILAPLAGSPAIDAGDPGFAPLELETDGRSLPRILDGDDDGRARIDIGACEAGEVIRVESLGDELDGHPPVCLREALTLGTEGDRILFDRSLNGGTIALAGGAAFGAPLGIDEDLTIDATNLPMGIVLSGNDQVQVAKIWEDADVSMIGLEITGGFTAGDGGGIEVEGSLLLSQCTVADNEAGGLGGGIYLDGGNLRGENLTLAGNTATQAGGALADNPGLRSRLSLAFTTLKDNTAGTGTGGMRLGNSEADFRFCYIGNHTGGTGNSNAATLAATTVTDLGGNLEDRNDVGFGSDSTVNLAAPQQPGPLADNGGFVRTCAANADTPVTTGFADLRFFPGFDARGYSRSVEFPGGFSPASAYGEINAGAHQWQGKLGDLDLDGLPDWWENRHGIDATVSNAAADDDGDASSNLAEYQAFTLPRDPRSVLRVLHFQLLPNDQASIVWSAVPGVSYEITSSTQLGDWKDSVGTATAVPGEVTQQRGFRLPMPPGPRRFYRVEVSGAP